MYRPTPHQWRFMRADCGWIFAVFSSKFGAGLGACENGFDVQYSVQGV
jgi:hypothetical protein